jgi:hypothetical protein
LTEARRAEGSFRDPAGFVFERDGVLYRQVNGSFAEDFDAFLASGLHQALLDEGLLVPHQEASRDLALTDEAHRVLEPERIGFISYPYEWSFSALRDAALVTLRAQWLAMDHGFSLRDASAFNVQFHRGRPVLIDTLSFGRRPEGEPWVAYRQFCQHFLAPLALMATRDVRLGQLLRVHVDGIPLDLAASLLPRRSRMRPGLFMHLAAHARSQSRRRRGGGDGAARGGFGERAFRGLVDSLERAVSRLSWEPGSSPWVGYYEEAESYSPEAADHKLELVQKLLAEADPRSVWDLGANTGRFSRLAAERGIPTVAFDLDAGAVERAYRETRRAGESALLLPLVLDLSNPSSSLGWAGRERMSLAERGPADLVMALALVHHLAIGNNVPLPEVASYLHELGRWALVEFVPKQDPKVAELLAVREDVFPHYTREGFERAVAEHFETVRREEIRGSGRVLYLLRGR